MKEQTKISRRNKIYSFALFLFSPVLSVVLAVQNYESRWAKNVVWLFVIFYAVIFTIPHETSDAYRYKTDFEDFYYLNGLKGEIEFGDFLSNFFVEEPNPKFRKPFEDIIHPTISYFVSNFTGNFRVMYFFVGVIFGYFYSRNIWFLFHSLNQRLKPIHLLIIAGLALIIPFWQLNSIRMWTAAHIYFYGLILFISSNRKSGIVCMGLSVLMHFSFLFPVLAFVIYLVLGNRPRLYFIFFLLTFLLNEVDLGLVRKALTSVVPDFFHDKVIAFTPEETLTPFVVKEKSWHAVYYGLALKWTIFTVIFSLYIYGRDKIKNIPFLYNLFSFTVLFLAASQLASIVPSGSRFLKIGYMLALYCLFFSIEYLNNSVKFKRTFYLVLPGLSFFCLVMIRIGFDSINMGILGNFFTFFTIGPLDTSLMEIIKGNV